MFEAGILVELLPIPGLGVATCVVPLNLGGAFDQVEQHLPTGRHAGRPRDAGTEEERVGARIRMQGEGECDEGIEHAASVDRRPDALAVTGEKA
jgi:hypothetical protein